MGMLQRVALPCLPPEYRAWILSPLHRQSPECPYLALMQPPHTSKAFALEPCREGQDSGATWNLCWHSCGAAAQVHPERCSVPSAFVRHTITMRDAPWDPPQLLLLLQVCLTSAKTTFIHACLSGIRSNYCLWGLNEEVCSD